VINKTAQKKINQLIVAVCDVLLENLKKDSVTVEHIDAVSKLIAAANGTKICSLESNVHVPQDASVAQIVDKIKEQLEKEIAGVVE
jgi:microcompartment protein CcmK/EutM